MEKQASKEPQKSDVIVSLIAVLISAALQAMVIWLNLPPQQRFWIRLEALGWLRSTASRLAWREGRAGMGEELTTGQRSARYLSAWGLGIAREWAVGQLEEMRP